MEERGLEGGPALDIRILGPIDVVRAGEVVAIGGHNARTVLAVLVAHRAEVVSAARMVDAIWEEHPPASASATLRSLVSRLRRALEPEAAIDRAASGYVLRAAVGVVDADRFGTLVDEARAAGDCASRGMKLAEAVALWRGGAFGELAANPWLLPEARRLDELHVAVLEDWGETRLACGESAGLVADLERLIVEHPLRERLLLALMRALDGAGRRVDALRRAHAFRTRLRDETGLAPSPTFDAVERVLLEPDAPSARPPPAASFPAFLADEGAFVARHDELRELRAALSAAAANQTTAVVISGETGIGKSRLAAKLAVEARAAGFRIAGGECDELMRPPLRPWIDALRALRSTAGAEALVAADHDPLLAAILISTAPAGASLTIEAATPGTGDEWRSRLFDAVGDLLVAHSEASPVMVVIDDLQWADTATLLLFRHLVRRAGNAPVLLVGAVREGEREGADERMHALADLRRRARVLWVRLNGLDLGATRALVEHLSGRPPFTGIAEKVHDATGGNPLFVGQLVENLHRGLGLDEPPTGIVELVGRQLDGLDRETNRLVDVGAVCGRTFDVLAAARVAGVDVDVALDRLDALLRAGLVVEDSGAASRFRFVHPLVRTCVLARLPRVRRARLHHLVAQHLEAGGGADPLELAHHWLEALPAGAPADLVAHRQIAAAHAALNRFAWEDALVQVRRAFDVPVDGPERLAHRYEAWLLGARALVQLGDNTRMREYAHAAADAARDLGDPQRQARAVLTLRGSGGVPTSYSDDLALVDHALGALADGDTAERALLLGLAASHSSASPTHCGESEAIAASAMAMAERLGDRNVLRQVLEDVAASAIDRPPAARLLELADRLERIAERDAPTSATVGIERLRLTAWARLGQRGRFDAERAQVATTTPVLATSLLGTDAAVALAAGHLTDARELHRRQRDATVTGSLWRLAWSDRELRLRWIEGDLDRALAGLESVRSMERQYPSLAATRALAYAIAGRDAEAHRLANSLLSEPGGVPWNLTRPRALTDLAQVAGVLDAVDLARLIEPMLAPYDGELLCPANMLLTIDGAAATFLGIIDTVLGRWDRARQHVEAGLSLEEGFGAMGLAAITRIWRANLDHRQPDGHVGGRDADLAEASRAGEALGFGIAPLVARRLERDLPS